MVIYFYIIISLLISFTQSSYLNNDNLEVNYKSIPITELFKENKNDIGFGCSIKNNRDIYYVSSTYQHNYYTSENYNCGRTAKYVEVLQYNLDSEQFVNSLLIGKNNAEYPNAIGNLGSDNVVSCGIDNKYNILYYIASNRYNCPSNYNFDSSIVRINLNNFQFMDRTILQDFTNKPYYIENNYYKYRYINTPTTSEIIHGDSLWLSFGTYYTGIWKLNITTPTVKLLDDISMKYYDTNNDQMGTGDNYKGQYNFEEIKKVSIMIKPD